MNGPTYIRVPEAHRALRVTAFRQSQRPQIVRIDGAHHPIKTSTIYGFAKAELRPAHRQSVDAYVLAQETSHYWLAIQVFSHSRSGWRQSAIRTKLQLRVPVLMLALDSLEEKGELEMPGVALKIVYSDGLIPQPPSGIAG